MARKSKLLVNFAVQESIVSSLADELRLVGGRSHLQPLKDH